MRILLVSSSARGHAIAQALARSTHAPELIGVSPSRNPGVKSLAVRQHVTDIMNFDGVLEIAKNEQPDWAFVGPDDPIGSGLCDAFEAMDIPCFAPRKQLAQVESSKGFTRELLKNHGVDASPQFAVFTQSNAADIEAFIHGLNDEYVVKYDALKGGKGVKVSGEHLSNAEEGIAYAQECVEECGQVVIEEKLIGVEFSLMSFVSGEQVVDMPTVQDHKRAYKGDTGPNTGGMGTYSAADHSLPFLQPSDIERAREINRLTAAALQQECGEPFKGILYGGFIAVKDGVRLIEYNARFGDPEALNVLPLLTTDFVDICQAVINGELTDDLVSFAHKATVCKYITPAGYPENKDQKGEAVEFPAMPENAELFYGDLDESDDGSFRLGGSRTAGIVGIGDSITEAEQTAQSLCEQVKGPVRFREDIGTNALVQQRVTTMEQLRA